MRLQYKLWIIADILLIILSLYLIYFNLRTYDGIMSILLIILNIVIILFNIYLIKGWFRLDKMRDNLDKLIAKRKKLMEKIENETMV